MTRVGGGGFVDALIPALGQVHIGVVVVRHREVSAKQAAVQAD
jgi:hypothetical protein